MKSVEDFDVTARILQMIDEGLKPTSISAILNIPLTMVYEVLEDTIDESDYDTVPYDEDEI